MLNNFRKSGQFSPLCWAGIIGIILMSYSIAFSWTAMDYQPKTTFVVTERNELKSDHNADGSLKVTSGTTPINVTGTISGGTIVVSSMPAITGTLSAVTTVGTITNPVQVYTSGSTNLVQLSGSTNTVVSTASGITVSQKIPSTFYAGGKTAVTTSASALSFGGNTTDTCYIQSLSTNTDNLYIGGSAAVTTAGVSVVAELSPGDMLPLKWNNLLNPLYIISGTSPQYYYKSATLAPLQ